MRKLVSILLICNLFVNCNNKKAEESVNSLNVALKQSNKKTNCSNFEILKDTILPNGWYLKYDIEDSVALIKWGNSELERILPDTVYCLIPKYLPHFDWANDKFIALYVGCGSLCDGAFILPLNKEDKIIYIEYLFEYDEQNNLVVYGDNSTYDALIIENLVTRQKQKVKLQTSCGSAFIGHCIDSISLTNKILYYQLSLPNNLDKNKTTIEHRIKINI